MSKTKAKKVTSAIDVTLEPIRVSDFKRIAEVDGVATYRSEINRLPSYMGLTEKEYKHAMNGMKKYSTHTVEIAGEIAAKEFKKHKNVNTVTVSAPWGTRTDSVDVTVIKEADVRVPGKGIQKMPKVTSSVKTSTFKVKSARNAVKEKILKEFY